VKKVLGVAVSAPPRVAFSSDPEGAAAFVNSARRCSTPCTVRFEGDPPCVVRLEYDEFKKWVGRFGSRAEVERLDGRLHVRMEME